MKPEASRGGRKRLGYGSELCHTPAWVVVGLFALTFTAFLAFFKEPFSRLSGQSDSI